MGKLDRLPPWAGALKLETMRGRIPRGRGRLFYALAALQTINDAVDRVEERRANLAGERRTFSLRYSPVFAKVVISIPIQKSPGGCELIGSVPESRHSSPRASIIEHRQAFGKGGGDEQEEYVNIFNRHIRPMVPMLGLALVVWDAWMAKAREATERELGPADILMFQPEWAEKLPEKVRERQGTAIYLLHEIGQSACCCRMLEII